MKDPKTKIHIQGREIQAGVPGQTLGRVRAMVPLERAGTPKEAAGAVYRFCIPESNYIRGQIVLVGAVSASEAERLASGGGLT